MTQSPPLPPNAVWRPLQGDGPVAHFYHANGFPVGVYEPLLMRLQQHFCLSALSMRPTWPAVGPPPSRRDWQIYADDLISYLDHHSTEPVVGIGHSMGAACTVLAAVQRPDLFRALILIEPVSASWLTAQLLRLMPDIVLRNVEPIQGTLKRRQFWSDRDEYVDACRQHPAYRRFDEEALLALKSHGVIEDSEGQLRLAFPRDWEAHNYCQPPYMLNHFVQLSVPCLAIRAKPSLFCPDALWKRWQSRCPRTVFLENPDFGHLLPVENAAATARLIATGLRQIEL